MTTFKLPAPREEVAGGTPLAAALLYPAFLVPDTAVGSSRWALSFLCPTKRHTGADGSDSGRALVGYWHHQGPEPGSFGNQHLNRRHRRVKL